MRDLLKKLTAIGVACTFFAVQSVGVCARPDAQEEAETKETAGEPTNEEILRALVAQLNGEPTELDAASMVDFTFHAAPVEGDAEDGAIETDTDVDALRDYLDDYILAREGIDLSGGSATDRTDDGTATDEATADAPVIATKPKRADHVYDTGRKWLYEVDGETPVGDMRAWYPYVPYPELGIAELTIYDTDVYMEIVEDGETEETHDFTLLDAEDIAVLRDASEQEAAQQDHHANKRGLASPDATTSAVDWTDDADDGAEGDADGEADQTPDLTRAPKFATYAAVDDRARVLWYADAAERVYVPLSRYIAYNGRYFYFDTQTYNKDNGIEEEELFPRGKKNKDAEETEQDRLRKLYSEDNIITNIRKLGLIVLPAEGADVRFVVGNDAFAVSKEHAEGETYYRVTAVSDVYETRDELAGETVDDGADDTAEAWDDARDEAVLLIGEEGNIVYQADDYRAHTYRDVGLPDVITDDAIAKDEETTEETDGEAAGDADGTAEDSAAAESSDAAGDAADGMSEDGSVDGLDGTADIPTDADNTSETTDTDAGTDHATDSADAAADGDNSPAEQAATPDGE